MKQFILTGISQETPLNNPDESILHLVFNHGEVRVPTNELGIQAILGCMAAEDEEPVSEPVQGNTQPGVEIFGGEAAEPEDDDDDDYEINDGVGSI